MSMEQKVILTPFSLRLPKELKQEYNRAYGRALQKEPDLKKEVFLARVVRKGLKAEKNGAGEFSQNV